MTTRIVVVDDHKLFREGLISLIKQQKGMNVVGEAENGRQALKVVKQTGPDIVIIDVAMPDMNGIEATKKIKKGNEKVQVLALSMHGDGKYVIEILKAGASGYILKDSAFEEIESAIKSVLDGKNYLSPLISDTIVLQYIRRGSSVENSVFETLSNREREILQLIAEGHSTKEIAFKLNVSIKTIDTHRHNIMKKVGVKSIANLVKYAIKEGITSLDK